MLYIQEDTVGIEMIFRHPVGGGELLGIVWAPPPPYTIELLSENFCFEVIW